MATGKTYDVDLRIRAKNLSKATLADINEDVEKLTKAQQDQAKASGLAARSLRELTDESRFLAAATKELERRRNLVDQYRSEQEEIKKLSAKLQELTAQRKAAADAAKASSGKGVDADVRALDKSIAQTNKSLTTLVERNNRVGDSLAGIGVDVKSVDSAFEQLARAAAASGTAQAGAIADVRRYSEAVQEQNAIIAEATRRRQAEADALASARKAFTANNERAAELNALRQDIEARSRVTAQRNAETEAARRTEAELAQEAAQRAQANARLSETVRLLEEQRKRRADATAAFTTGLTAQERETRILAESNARRDRLVALLQSEKGQRVLAAEQARRQAQDLAKNTDAQTRNAQATEKAAKAQGLFDDTGRKSLSTYQRIRGQVLGLITAYVGVYEAINTVQKSIEATSRNQALRAGLLTGAGGDQAQAAKNYEMLRKEADKLGLVFDQVAPRFVNMDIAGRSAGLTAEQTAEAFQNLAKSAAARNLNLDDTEGAFRAIEQMFSKGRVQAEELRGQLAERLPGAVAIFAKANNMSLAELDKALQKGQVGVDFVVRGLRAYAQQFDGQMNDLTERLSAYINRAQNAYNDWLRALISGDNQTRLKQALSEITRFFSGTEGQKFAQALGDALAKVIDAFILLAKNIDTVMTVLKAFLALQVAKFFVDVGTSIYGAVKALVAFRAATVAAATETGKMSVASRALTALMGPLGVAIAAVGGIWLSYKAYVDDANNSMDRFIDTLHRARQAKGTDAIAQSMQDIDSQLRDVNAELEKAVKARDDLTLRNGLIANQVQAAKGLFGGGALTPAEAESDVAVALEKQKALQQEKLNLQTKYNRALAEEQQAQKDLASQPLPSTAPGATTKDHTPKGPDPESVRDRILKTTEDLRAKLANVEIQANARTAEQIETNYQATLDRIDAEVAKAQINLDAMARDANKANKGKGVDVTDELTTARGALEAYKQAAVEAAERDRTTAQIELREKNINDLIAQRDAKLQLINALQQTGAISTAQAWMQARQTNEEYNAQINQGVTDFITMLSEIPETSKLYNALGIPQTIAQMRVLQAETSKSMALWKQAASNFAPQIAQGLGEAVVDLGKGLAGVLTQANSLSDAFKGAMDTFRTFAADFLQRIAQMIIQAIILQAIQNALNGTSGGYGGAIMSAFGSKHNGGIAGRQDNGNATRMVSPLVFAGAQRFHDGGLPGLKPNEVPTILKKGEEVLTEDDPRHVGNLDGSSGPAPITLNNNIMLDPVDLLRQALARPEGTRVLASSVQSNRTTFKSALS